MEGLSGTGKSSVYEELIGRGYRAISTDRAWQYHADGSSLWHEQRALRELESPEQDVLFVCGSSHNRDRFLPHFAGIFNLCIDDETMRRRLAERANNDFGKQPEELELMLRLNRDAAKPAGAVDVDATRPLDEVVDEVLRLAQCPALSDAPPVAWSKLGSAIAESFVIPEAALPVARGALACEAVTHLDYSWSGHVLEALISFLEGRGIDLGPERSTIILTTDHRERYLARLDPTEFDGPELRRYYERRDETTADGVEYAMLDGIAFLRDTLAALDAGLVAVCVIASRPG